MKDKLEILDEPEITSTTRLKYRFSFLLLLAMVFIWILLENAGHLDYDINLAELLISLLGTCMK